MHSELVDYIPIRRLIRRKTIVRWLIMVIVAGSFALLFCIARPYCDANRQKLMLACTVVLYGFIFWKSRALQRVCARERTGIITAREVNRAIKPAKGVTRGFSYIVRGKWTVLLDPRPGQDPSDSEVITLSYDTEEIGEGLYKVGEHVRLFANAPYMVKAYPAPDDEELICPLCARPTRTSRCDRCLVDFSTDTASPSEPMKQGNDGDLDTISNGDDMP